MASLIENLLDALEKENAEYEQLLELSIKKTGIIVKADLDGLNDIVEKEQVVVERINALEKRRIEATNDIASVLNKNPATLTLTRLAELLVNQKAEYDAINSIHDRLKDTLSRMSKVNDSNKALLQESIEMVQFEMNIVQSLRQAPETANYSGNSYADNSYSATGSFDAKQ